MYYLIPLVPSNKIAVEDDEFNKSNTNTNDRDIRILQYLILQLLSGTFILTLCVPVKFCSNLAQNTEIIMKQWSDHKGCQRIGQNH